MPATLSYDSATNIATLTPQAALQYGVTYTATVKGGAGGVTDYVGNPLALGRELVVHHRGLPAPAAGRLLERQPLRPLPDRDPAQRRARCLHDARYLAALASVLSNFDVVVLGDGSLTPARWRP